MSGELTVNVATCCHSELMKGCFLFVYLRPSRGAWSGSHEASEIPHYGPTTAAVICPLSILSTLSLRKKSGGVCQLYSPGLERSGAMVVGCALLHSAGHVEFIIFVSCPLCAALSL